MKQKILKYFLVFFSLLFSFFLWNSIDRAVNIPEASIWKMPIIWSSFFFIAFSLAAILIKRKWILDLIFLFCLVLVFIFSFNMLQIFAVALGALLGLFSVGRFRRDMSLNIKIDLKKTLRTGSTLFIVALAIIISTQYYWK